MSAKPDLSLEDSPSTFLSLTVENPSNEQINATSFVAYDQRFFSIIGAAANVEKLQTLPFQVHEAPCYIPGDEPKLFFVEWGPRSASSNGTHDWQYLLDLRTNNLTRIRTEPPTYNVHGCVYRDEKLHVVTDGGPQETPYLATIDPGTWERKTLLNNYYERPFISFNDLEMDGEGNYYLTDSVSGWVSRIMSLCCLLPSSLIAADGFGLG